MLRAFLPAERRTLSMSWMRKSVWIAGFACLALPGAAQAQYRIEASGCGPQPTAASTTEPGVSRIGGAANMETGSYTECISSVGGVNGVLEASTTLSFTGGAIGLMPATSTAAFREQLWIDGLQPGATTRAAAGSTPRRSAAPTASA